MEERIMEQSIIDLYNDCDLRFIGRREFLTKLAVIAGGVSAAYSLLSILGNDYTYAEVVSKDDPRIRAEYVNYRGATGDIRAYLAAPHKEAKMPGIVVIHEIFGLNSHIEDVARRLATEDFLTLAPDALSPVGGTPEDQRESFTLTRQLDGQTTVDNYVAAVKYLQSHPRSNGNVGVIGFCWGGGISNQVAVNCPELKAAVPFYGSQPKSEDVQKIKASLLLHYAGNDDRINQGIAAFEEALKKASIDYRLYMYEGTKHAFFNDTNPDRYSKEASQLAWKRTIEFLNEMLRT
jgi:carboxymethylenebutenolidase